MARHDDRSRTARAGWNASARQPRPNFGSDHGYISEPRGDGSGLYGQYGMRDPRDEGRRRADEQAQFDPDYRQWRREHMNSLDNDYREWRHDRFQRFSDEFSTWRSQRNPQAAPGLEEGGTAPRPQDTDRT